MQKTINFSIAALVLFAGSVLGDAFYFKTNKQAEFKGRIVFTQTQGDVVRGKIYWFEVTESQYNAGFNALPAGFVQSKIAAIDAKVMSDKPANLRNAENYVIKFLRDEGYIPVNANAVTGDVESAVFSNLSASVNSAPAGVGVTKSARFTILRENLHRAGGTVNKSVFNP